MRYRKLTLIIWISASIFFAILIGLLVHFESHYPNSNIKDIPDAIWYTLVTIATVGYGDKFPLSHEGKVIGAIIVASSFLTMGYMVGNLTNIIRNFMEKKKLGFYGTDFKNHVIIIGWNKFGQQVADQIIHANKQVTIVTNEKNDIDVIYDTYGYDKVFALFMDFHNIEMLRKGNVEKSSCVFINFMDDTEALVYVINMKTFFPHLKYVVSLTNSKLKDTFTSAGVTYAISKNEIASRIVASYIFEPDVASITEDIMSTAVDSSDYDIEEYIITDTNPFINKDYLEVFFELKTKYNCILLGISQNGVLYKNASKGMIIRKNDYLILIANGDTKKHIETDFGVKEGRII